jgi:hypothetical protein
MARPDRLSSDDGVRVHAVLAEGALLTEVGGPEVMRVQLKRLRELADMPNITIQVCRFKGGAHAATGFPFILLRLPNSDGLDVVYLEDQTSARYIDNDPEEQQKYGLIWSYLTRAALTPAKTRKYLDPGGRTVKPLDEGGRTMAPAEPLRWRKSSRSGGNGDCVEVAHLGRTLAVRDSKNPAGPSLFLTPTTWQAFLTDVRANHH